MSNLLNKVKTFIKANREVIVPTAVLALICIVITASLSGTNLLTQNRIKALEEKSKNAAMQKLISADDFPEETLIYNDNEVIYNVAKKDDKTIGYLFTTTANGYGGNNSIKVMTAIDTNGAIIAIEILDASSETPGLGQNVTKEEFYSQFKGKSNQIDAVTGATISSKGVTDAVNQALDYAKQLTINTNDTDDTVKVVAKIEYDKEALK